MVKSKNVDYSEKLSKLIVKGMQEKKASDIIILDLRKIKNAIASFFVLCSGNSDTQVDAISESIDSVVSYKLNENAWRCEGKKNKEWILIDYVTVVAHVFKKESRSNYGLEKLWGDAEITRIEQ